MKKFKTPKIICPKCNLQYLPGEIYLPKEFLGQPKRIEKDCYGRIVNYYEHSMNLSEKYTCDKCGTTFSVRAKVIFDTYIDEESNLKPYVTKLKQEKLQLTE